MGKPSLLEEEWLGEVEAGRSTPAKPMKQDGKAYYNRMYQ
jgi:hypothetical protein